MFGRMTATPLVRLDAGKSLELTVAELLATTEYPQIARWIQFPAAVALFVLRLVENPRLLRDQEWFVTAGRSPQAVGASR